MVRGTSIYYYRYNEDFYQTYDNIQTKLLKELEKVELDLYSLNNHKDEYDLNF